MLTTDQLEEELEAADEGIAERDKRIKALESAIQEFAGDPSPMLREEWADKFKQLLEEG